jgi:hypothetical protein
MTKPAKALLFVAATALAMAFGCATILGVEDISFGDAGMKLVTDDGAVIDVPPGPPECDAAIQCQDKLTLVPVLEAGAPPSTGDAGLDGGDAGMSAPRRCATVQCVSNRCVLFARDEDGDKLTIQCASSDPKYPVQKSKDIDCDDTQPGVVTESQVDCTDGTFALPGKGACRPGKARCKSDGTFDTCIGAIGVKPDLCDNQLDENCDGTIDNGCPCGTGAVRNCGPSIDAGICQNGQQVCVGAMWGNCSAVFPTRKNCSNGLDNDCNGVADTLEPFCNREPPGGGRK